MSFHLTVECESEGESERTVSLEVSRLHWLGEIYQSVYKQLKPDLTHDQSHYGLYMADKKVWLKLDQPVGRALRGRDRAHLQFRLKTRSVTIRFLDASSKIFVINESLTVKEIVADICSQMSLEHPEELSLVVAVDYAVDKHHPASTGESTKSPVLISKKEASTTNGAESPRFARKKPSSRPSSASSLFGRTRASSFSNSLQIKKQISRKHQMRIDTPWLDPNKSLSEQDVTESDELLLMYRFYYNMELDRNSTAVDMLYKQGRATFLAKEMTCSEEDIPRFTAILCQIAYGDFISKEDTQDKLHKLKKTLLPAKLKSKPFVKEVAAFHILLNGISVQEAKCWFVKQWSSMKLFGTEFFSCSNWDTKEKGLVGVSKDEIVFRHHNTKKANLKLDMNSIQTWELDSDSNVISLIVLKEGTLMKLTLHFPMFYSSIFIDCLQGNRSISSEISGTQLALKEFQFDEELESHYTRYTGPAGGSCTHPDVQKVGSKSKHKRSGSLTLNDVLYWNDAIETPLVSKEEKDSWKTKSWENPAFGNLDQLMDERFSFLDFENEQKSTIDPQKTRSKSQASSSPESSPSTDHLSSSSLTDSPNVHLRVPQMKPLGFTTTSPLTVNKVARELEKNRESVKRYNGESSSSTSSNSPEVTPYSRTM